MITKAEYQHRRQKLQEETMKQGLDAYLVASEESIYYLTGASYKPFERPFFNCCLAGALQFATTRDSRG